MKHPSLIKWEGDLKKVLDELDDFLEDRFGSKYQLHPARLKRGKAYNKAQDGLFDISAGFTLGISSKHGKGYVVDIRMSTLDNVPQSIQLEIEDLAVKKLQDELPKYFPGKNLNVSRDGLIIKIYGDLSLGKA